MSGTEVGATREVEEMVAVGDGMRLCFRAAGNPSDPALLLVAGLGQQLNVWPAGFVDGLLDRGFYVIRFDNRDVGRSSSAQCPPPTPVQFLRRRFSPVQYTLAEMAADTAGLLDALSVEHVHLVGMSMGGMIAQGVAAREPDRVISLTSIMSTTGAPKIGRPAPSTWMRMALPPAKTRHASADRFVAMMRHVRSRGFPFEEEAVRAVALECWDRAGGSGVAGGGRQLAAILKSGDRTRELARIEAPTLVIHGDYDLLVNPTGGRATADAIPGARLLTIPGMGHDLPPGACAQLVEEIANHAERAAALAPH